VFILLSLEMLEQFRSVSLYYQPNTLYPVRLLILQMKISPMTSYYILIYICCSAPGKPRLTGEHLHVFESERVSE